MGKTVGIIGAGVAGLTAALQLARAGHTPTVFERNDTVGGKIQEETHQSYRFDIGPSVITLPHIIGSILPLAYTEQLFKPVNPICTYWWNDRQRFVMTGDVVHDDQQFSKQFGERSGAYRRYFSETERLYHAVAPVFLTKPIHHPSLFISRLFWKSLPSLPLFKLPLSLHSFNRRFFTHRRAVQIFDRFATYNGSSPYRLSSLYAIISYIEVGFGVYLFPHGTRQLIDLFAKYARELDIDIRTNTSITAISTQLVGSKRTVQSLNSNGQSFLCDVAINAADYYSTLPLFTTTSSVGEHIPTYDTRADPPSSHTSSASSAPKHQYRSHVEVPPQFNPVHTLSANTTSTSAIIFLWGITKTFPDLSLHNIFFGDDYEREFKQLFELATIPLDPTIYVNITAKYVKSDAPPNSENWFVMINVPASPTIAWSNVVDYVRHKTLAKLSAILQTNLRIHIEYERVLTPLDIGDISNAYCGALYGRNSHGITAALVRPPNKAKHYHNLYNCSGTAHPGGGIPLSILSGHIVANLIDKNGVESPTIPLNHHRLGTK